MGDLSNLGTGDFQVSFTLQTTQQDDSIAILNQRTFCSADDFWDIRIQNGNLIVETDNASGADDAFTEGCTTVTDGTARQVVVQRVNEVLSIYLDGLLDAQAASTASWGSLPALATGTDVCVGTDGTVNFDATKGSLTNVCVSTGTTSMSGAAMTSCY